MLSVRRQKAIPKWRDSVTYKKGSGIAIQESASRLAAFSNATLPHVPGLADKAWNAVPRSLSVASSADKGLLK
jgi:hypothetical protein